VRVFYWVDSKMGYALSSGDIGKDELLKVATPSTSSSIP
jgi:anti-sigma factor RsiW